MYYGHNFDCNDYIATATIIPMIASKQSFELWPPTIIAISWLLHPLSVPMIASDYMTAWSTTIAWTARMKSNDNDNSNDDHETKTYHNNQ